VNAGTRSKRASASYGGTVGSIPVSAVQPPSQAAAPLGVGAFGGVVGFIPSANAGVAKLG